MSLLSVVNSTWFIIVVVTDCGVVSVLVVVTGSGIVSGFDEVTESRAVLWDIVIVSDVVCPLSMSNSGAMVVIRIVTGSGMVVLSVVVESRVSPLCVDIDSAALSPSSMAATSAIN